MDESKKYIRTFEGDMEIFKKGGTPDLKPLAQPATPIPVPTQTSVPVKVPEPPPISKPEPSSSPIETYSGDFSQRIKDTNASTATVLAAEQDALSGAPQNVSEKPSRGNIIYIIAGIVLLIIGSIGAYIAYTRYSAKVEPIIIAPTVSAPIFVDEKEKILKTGPNAILQAIEQSVTRSLAPNTVRFLYTDFSTTTDNSVFSALQLPVPGALLRNVNATRSMAGIVSAGGVQNPFFILSVASYGDTFAGMLSWEKTMPRDLSALFPSYAQGPEVQVFSTTTPITATSTPFIIPSFRDEVVNNHDVRIYRDAEGRSILLYGYWNQTTLVIARDSAAFIEIIGRLATAHTQ